ncbi:MAG: hypothetical protein WCI67_22450 [Chloroflexales bacterium]
MMIGEEVQAARGRRSLASDPPRAVKVYAGRPDEREIPEEGLTVQARYDRI